jgi:hypothetical protein
MMARPLAFQAGAAPVIRLSKAAPSLPTKLAQRSAPAANPPAPAYDPEKDPKVLAKRAAFDALAKEKRELEGELKLQEARNELARLQAQLDKRERRAKGFVGHVKFASSGLRVFTPRRERSTVAK